MVEQKTLSEQSLVIDYHADIEDDPAEVLMHYLSEEICERVDEVILRIKSNGGSSSTGFELYDQIKSLPFDVTTYAASNVESSAVPLYLAGSKRIVAPQGRFLIHGAGLQNVGRGTKPELLRAIEIVDHDNQRTSNIISDETNITQENFQDIVNSGKDSLYCPEEAVKTGISNEITRIKLPSKYKGVRIGQDKNGNIELEDKRFPS